MPWREERVPVRTETGVVCFFSRVGAAPMEAEKPMMARMAVVENFMLMILVFWV